MLEELIFHTFNRYLSNYSLQGTELSLGSQESKLFSQPEELWRWLE